MQFHNLEVNELILDVASCMQDYRTNWKMEKDLLLPHVIRYVRTLTNQLRRLKNTLKWAGQD
ncbi:hypothetical protein DRP05_02865 [Archaeoglobales archaeon]|nr:MAG: hypothetical protein DRP05_02865 [Archaeoglobales archaeon]